MRIAVLLLVGGGLAATGCNSRRAEQQAFSEAEKAVAFYLPRLAKDPNLATGELRSSQLNSQALDNLRRIGQQKFLTLTGDEGYSSPGLVNIQGYRYLTARRRFGPTAVPVIIYAMNPGEFALDRSEGLVITNDVQATGLAGVQELKFMVDDVQISGIRVYVSHSGVGK